MIIAVTGGSGSGKTTLCQYLESKGAAVVDADFLGWEVLKDESVKHKLQRAFGEEILAGNDIDRAKLAELAFRDETTVNTLNAITHPLLKQKLKGEATTLSRSNEIVLVDVALHHELNVSDMVDKTILIRTTESALKDRISKQRLERRVHQKKIKGADYVIDNDGSLDDLYQEADLLWKKLKNQIKE